MGPNQNPDRYANARVFLLYSLLSVLVTFPLVLNFATSVPGHGADDPYVAWNIWWVKWSLIDLGSNPLYSNYIFFPIGVNLGTYTLTLLNGLISIPLQLVWDVIPSDNLIILLSTALSSFGAYLLVTDLSGDRKTRSRFGGVVAGLVYGFAAYRYQYLYLGGINFVSNQWLPFYMLYLRRVFKTSGSARDGLLAGIFLVFTGLTETTLAAFLSLMTVGYLMFRIVVDRVTLFRRQVLINLIVLGVTTLIGLAPLIAAIGGELSRNGNFLLSGPNRAEFLSADLLSFFIPSQHNPWLGFVSRDLPYHNMDFAFVGYITLILAIIGLAMVRARNELAFWGIVALFFALVMLGPVLHVGNQVVESFPLPFRLIQYIPLLSANRLPVRYNHLLMLALAVLAGCGLDIMLTRFPRYRALAILIPVLILIEHLGAPLSLSNLRAPPVYERIAADPGDFTVLDLPLSWSSSTLVLGDLYTQSQFYQTVHRKRLLGGNTSRTPAFKFQYFNELPVIHSIILLESGGSVDDSVIAEDARIAPEVERFFNIRYVVARKDLTDSNVLDYARRVFTLSPFSDDSLISGFRVEPKGAGDLAIEQSQAISRLYFDDQWGRPQTGVGGTAYRWATTDSSAIYVPLKSRDYRMCGMYAGSRVGQKMIVSVNDVQTGEFYLSPTWAQHCVDLAASSLRLGANLVTFQSNITSIGSSAFSEERRIGRTGAIAPIDIAVTSGGFAAGKFASITVDGKENYATKRGFYFIALDPQHPESRNLQVFDTFRDEAESARLADFIRRLPQGTIVAGAVCDEATRNLNEEAVNSLHLLGLGLDIRGKFRSSYAFIGMRGAQPGSAVEVLDPSYPANASVGKNVTTPNVSFALGRLEFVQSDR